MVTYRIDRTTVKIVQGDITDQTTDAIVNAANSTLSANLRNSVT